MYTKGDNTRPSPTRRSVRRAPWRPGMEPPTQMMEYLWQGPAVPTGTYLAEMGFDVVVLCAQEHQPRSVDIPGVLLIHCPYDDNGEAPPPRDLAMVKEAARRVVDHVRQRRHVLVTCRVGWNRSGLVTALALRQLCRVPGATAAEFVQRKREGALSNAGFVSLLNALPAR